MAKLEMETLDEMSRLIRDEYNETDGRIGEKLALILASDGAEQADHFCIHLMAQSHINQAIRLMSVLGLPPQKIAEEFYRRADELVTSKINRG